MHSLFTKFTILCTKHIINAFFSSAFVAHESEFEGGLAAVGGIVNVIICSLRNFHIEASKLSCSVYQIENRSCIQIAAYTPNASFASARMLMNVQRLFYYTQFAFFLRSLSVCSCTASSKKTRYIALLALYWKQCRTVICFFFLKLVFVFEKTCAKWHIISRFDTYNNCWH